MKKILAFAGSTSSTSINKKLATYGAENLKITTFDSIDLRDFDMPIFSEDEEKENGFHVVSYLPGSRHLVFPTTPRLARNGRVIPD